MSVVIDSKAETATANHTETKCRHYTDEDNVPRADSSLHRLDLDILCDCCCLYLNDLFGYDNFFLDNFLNSLRLGWRSLRITSCIEINRTERNNL